MKQNHPVHRSGTVVDAPPSTMSSIERRAVAALSGIFSLRMLGLFMFLPVFSVHAHEYPGHTPLLIGVAIGIYGLTQGVFQVPFGILSDRFGRRPVIAAGLLVFALGSVVAALADDIWGSSPDARCRAWARSPRRRWRWPATSPARPTGPG